MTSPKSLTPSASSRPGAPCRGQTGRCRFSTAGSVTGLEVRHLDAAHEVAPLRPAGHGRRSASLGAGILGRQLQRRGQLVDAAAHFDDDAARRQAALLLELADLVRGPAAAWQTGRRRPWARQAFPTSDRCRRAPRRASSLRPGTLVDSAEVLPVLGFRDRQAASTKRCVRRIIARIRSAVRCG